MGSKIITEKDFWMCSSGAMAAQLQGTRKSNKKSTGEVYITVADTATSSWIDFGCTKNMLLSAIITAVVAIVVVVAIVATGGMAAVGIIGMMAIGAGAGAIGGTIAAIGGALTCGQKNATNRTWDKSKSNMILTGTPAITGDCTMTCSVGGVVKFAPEVKSWMHALALGGFNYITQLAGAALGGAGIGALGFLGVGVAGGSLGFASPTWGSIWANVAGGFIGIWGSSRALFGLNHVANEHAYGHVDSIGDGTWAVVDGGVPEIGMAKRLLTGKALPTDYMIFLYLLNIKAKGPKPAVEEPKATGDKDGQPSGDKDGNPTNKEEGQPQSKGQGKTEPKPKKDSKGDAYEADPLPDGNGVPEGVMKGRRPSKPEYTVLDADGNLTEYGKWYYERPSGFRKGVREKTYEAAKDDRVVKDPLTEKEIPFDSEWDMGHKPKHEFRKHQKDAANRNISRKEFLNEHNKPEHYRPETQNTNRSHRLEDHTGDFE